MTCIFTRIPRSPAADWLHRYRNPKITGNNYNKFVTTISPTSTHIKPSPLSALVKRLDLSALVHHGRPSHNARLLRRVHSSLEEFVAPQSSFGFSCIVALGHCRSLQVLDLSLVSQTMSLDELFRHIADLPCLRELNFPRSSLVAKTSQFTFPVNLQRFSLSGAVITLFSHDTVLPPALEELHISHCPFTKAPTIVSLLARLGDQLTTLSVSYPMPYLAFNSMDNILNLCPNLTYLLVAVDYISSHFFDEGSAHPLEHLDLDSSGSAGNELKVSPNDVFIAMAEDRLPHLRIVRVSKLLKWVEREREDVDDLVEMLETKAFEADPVRNVKVGVWEFGGERGNR